MNVHIGTILISRGCVNDDARVPHPHKHDLDEIALAERLAIGDTQKQCADDLGVGHPVIARRVRRWRQTLGEQVKDDPAKVLYWRDTASVPRVARRWLYVKTGAPRWRPLEIEM